MLLYFVAIVLLSFMSLALIGGIVFIGSERWPLMGESLSPQRRWNNGPGWGFLNYRENNSGDLRDRAQSYLLCVVALTNATAEDDGYILNVGTNTFHVRDRYIRRIRGVKDAKSHYEQTCFFVPNQGMPSAEQIATVLLMLKNDPTLFDKWAVKNGVSFKADGRSFEWSGSE